MAFRQLLQIRRFSTSKVSYHSLLSEDYKCKKLWEARLNCPLLSGDEQMIKSINTKIILGKELSSIETDVFINIAVPSIKEIAQLQESVKLIQKLRKSLYAHTLMQSTPHAMCRLFLESDRLETISKILSKRVEYGIFPDFFVMNLLLDRSIDEANFALASKMSTSIMFQEEFGENCITDHLALFSVSKYIETKTNFEDWPNDDVNVDPILAIKEQNIVETIPEKSEKKEEEYDEDEDDAEYIRIPFLRNSYFDNHFDLDSARLICGKTLEMLGRTFVSHDSNLSALAVLLGHILQGKWEQASQMIEKQHMINLGAIKVPISFYIENLHGIAGPNEDQKDHLIKHLEKTKASNETLSELVKLKFQKLTEHEKRDIDQFKTDLQAWSTSRLLLKARQDDKIENDKLIAEIEAKKEELKLKEQYLYFYDNLHKSKISRINYD